MYAFRNSSWIALAAVFSLAAPAARAGWITPDSIPNPPSAVSSADGTSIYANNLVTTQYAGLGLSFPAGTAIAQLNNVNAWTPLGIVAGGPVAAIDYAWGVSGTILSPGSSNPTTVSSLSVETVGPASVSMSVYGLKPGLPLNITPRIGLIADLQDWTFTGSGISSFTVSGTSSNLAWGVDQISFTPTQATTPEPSSLVLAGLGVLGLVPRQRLILGLRKRVRPRIHNDNRRLRPQFLALTRH